MTSLISGIAESLGQGWLQDKATEFAGERFQPTKDPYYEQLPDGKKVRRRLPHYCSKQESKVWKKLQNQAWSHDKGICGSCCWSETIGWAPMLTLIPIIGPAIMYSIHGKLIEYAKKQFQLPNDVVMKMHGNIGIDLAISLVPILGTVFAWMNACSTRNCAMVYNFVCERALEKYNHQMKDKMRSNPGSAGVGASKFDYTEKTNGKFAGSHQPYAETVRQYARPAAPTPGRTKDTTLKAKLDDDLDVQSYAMEDYRKAASQRPAQPQAYGRPAAAIPSTAQARAQRPYV